MNKQKGFTLVEGLIILLVAIVVGAVGWYVVNRQNNESTNIENTTSAAYKVYETSEQIAPLLIEYPPSLTFLEESSSDPAVTFTYGENLVKECGADDSLTKIDVVNVTQNSEGRISTISAYQTYLVDQKSQSIINNYEKGFSATGPGTEQDCFPDESFKTIKYATKSTQTVFTAANGDVYTVAATIPDVNNALSDGEALALITDIKERIIEKNDDIF